MAGEDVPNFDIGADGFVTLHPLVTCRTGLFAGMTCGLRIEYRQEQTGPTDTLQLALTPEQARALAELLVELAVLAEQPPAPGSQPS